MQIAEPVCETHPEDSDLSHFEQQIGAVLPTEYRQFLAMSNGGRPIPCAFSFTTREGTQEDSRVHYFFGLHSGRVGSLQREAMLRGQRIPQDYLPIATDPFGNRVLIGIAKWNHGRIYFWDHERESDPPSIKNISEVAASFSGFISELEE